MDINNLTIGQARELAQMFPTTAPPATLTPQSEPHAPIAVVVCTDKCAVVFGTTTDINARPIILNDARMCLYWSADVGGVFGLAEKGPSTNSKISAEVGTISLEGVTAIMSASELAAAAWRSAPVQGRK
jgi:hypothetical protein